MAVGSKAVLRVRELELDFGRVARAVERPVDTIMGSGRDGGLGLGWAGIALWIKKERGVQVKSRGSVVNRTLRAVIGVHLVYLSSFQPYSPQTKRSRIQWK